ncbi:hypothetical protein O181_018918 [Austropuccinia psidii MF-1]|uniref:Uncharacterized protein n=1 Tax=Austropuccinia psidii MF-1 TaxID=1389203 RepID=A0A9Q3C9Z6_9BASI|nr:hypothetical protein [Austropuccinia psidii MF-1]
MNHFTLQHSLLGKDYLNIYGFNINNHQERYFTSGENKRQKFSLPLERNGNKFHKRSKNASKERLVADKLIEEKIIPELTKEIREDLFETIFQSKEAFASHIKPLGAINGNEVDIIFNLERTYPPLLRRRAYTARPRAREALDSHANLLMKLGVLRDLNKMRKYKLQPL